MASKTSKVPKSVIQMKNIGGILITVTGYTYSPGKNSLRKQMSADSYKDFQIYMAEQLLGEFVRAIDTQRYKSGSKAWKPLSLKYKTWKKTHNLSLNIWEATGHMKDSLKIFKKGNMIAVGFKQTDIYPKSYAKVNQIARYLEYGGNKNPNRPPSRPLFRPIVEYCRKNVSRYYKKYQKELKASKKQFLYL
jgi:hypothetical protein